MANPAPLELRLDTQEEQRQITGKLESNFLHDMNLPRNLAGVTVEWPSRKYAMLYLFTQRDGHEKDLAIEVQDALDLDGCSYGFANPPAFDYETLRSRLEGCTPHGQTEVSGNLIARYQIPEPVKNIFGRFLEHIKRMAGHLYKS